MLDITAVSFIQRQGFTKSRRLLKLTLKIFRLSSSVSDSIEGGSYSRPAERSGRHGVTLRADYSLGVAPFGSSLPMGDSEVALGVAGDRLVCQSMESPPSSLRISMPGFISSGSERIDMSSARESDRIRVPTSSTGRTLSIPTQDVSSVPSLISSSVVGSGEVGAAPVQPEAEMSL